MKKVLFFLLIAFICGIGNIFSQSPLKETQAEFTYQIQRDNGTNASAVVWHPEKKLYFTLIAGNRDYPFEAFDSKGTSVYAQDIKIDARGMWYNKRKKRLEINGAGDIGWHFIKINKDMTLHTIEQIISGQNQPDFNSVGTFDNKKQVIFFNTNNISIELYNYSKPEKKKETPLEIKTGTVDSYNYTSIGFTGKKDYEYVLLNYENYKLIYFNLKGVESGSTKLPGSAVVSERFKFSYANERVFLYDIDTRTWTAYKVF